MKTIGIIGGLTWLSTVEYYKLMNQLTNQRLGGVSSARILMYSVNFEDIKKPTLADDWLEIIRIIGEAAVKLEQAGADCLLLGANTMHKIAPGIAARISIPLIHIADATAKTIQQQGIAKVALLGTIYTMKLPFYRDILEAKNIEVIIPADDDADFINNAIYTEMGKGLFLPATKERFLKIIEDMRLAGAQGIIMGCTEIPILLKDEPSSIPLFDTTLIHATAAVDFSLA